MSAGGIAAIIAASAFLIISLAIAYAVVRLGRAIDEVGTAVKEITNETTPLLNEVTTTVELVNGPLGISFVGYEPATRLLIFQDKTGATVKHRHR